MFIFQIDPGKILGAENKKDVSKPIENPDSVLLNSMSRTHPIIQPPGVPVPPNNQIPPAMLFGKIVDLSNALLMDPYHHLHEISTLGKALAEYTHTEYDLGKADKLFDFFLRDKSDLTGDGKLDHNDVIAFWHSLDKPQMPDFPDFVDIDLDKDGKYDYVIRNNKIFKLFPPGSDPPAIEVDSIPGVNLKELSDKIKQHWGEEEPGIGLGSKFDDDINGDGKIDHIRAYPKYGW